MSRHSLERRGPSLLPRLLLLGGGAVITAIAWVYQVGAAIDFAKLALSGVGRAWWFVGTSSIGAIVCLVLVMVLSGRALRLLGFLSGYRPRRAAPRRAATRSPAKLRATTSRATAGAGTTHSAAEPVEPADHEPVPAGVLTATIDQPDCDETPAPGHRLASSLQAAISERRKPSGRRATPPRAHPRADASQPTTSQAGAGRQ